MILLVGKPGPLRDALHSLLNAMPDLAPITTADGGLPALQQIRECVPALVFIAGGLPEQEAMELVCQIGREAPGVPCLVVADHPSYQHLARWAGAEVLPGDTPFAEMRAVVSRLLLDAHEH